MSLRVDQNTAKFGKMHAVVAESNNHTVKNKLSMNSPMVLHDTEGKISSELNKIIDGNYTSCINLPKTRRETTLVYVDTQCIMVQYCIQTVPYHSRG